IRHGAMALCRIIVHLEEPQMRGVARRAWVIGIVLWSATVAASAQVILDAAQVREALQRGVQVWDVRPDKDYARVHLPGALSAGDAAAVLRDANSEDFLPTPEIAA